MIFLTDRRLLEETLHVGVFHGLADPHCGLVSLSKAASVNVVMPQRGARSGLISPFR